MICRVSDAMAGSVGVFCAASESIDCRYFDYAHEIGALIGDLGFTLVYGGAAAGLMEATAMAAKECGAHIVGVVPRVLIERNRVSALLDERVVTANLSERKDEILGRSDILVALPGGIGTLDEIFHVAAAATIGYHSKKVVLYNADGYWDALLSALGDMQENGFVRGGVDNFFVVANDINELRSILENI